MNPLIHCLPWLSIMFPCVKAHKLRTCCSGKRDKTEFVPLSRFDDNLLLSGSFYLSTLFNLVGLLMLERRLAQSNLKLCDELGNPLRRLLKSCEFQFLWKGFSLVQFGEFRTHPPSCWKDNRFHWSTRIKFF